MRSTTACRISAQPCPVLADTRSASLASSPMVLFNFLDDLLRASDRQIDLVEHRYDFEIVVESEIHIRQRLRFHPLGCVHHQQATLASGQRPRHLVVEVDMTGGINEIELVSLAIGGGVGQSHRLGL